MNREVHVRFWERAEVKYLRATRQTRSFADVRAMSAFPPEAVVERTSMDGRFVP
jgi:hypothetical protein